MPSAARKAPMEVLLSPRIPIGCRCSPASQSEGNYFLKRERAKKCRWHNHKMSVEQFTRKKLNRLKLAKSSREPTRLVPP